MPTQEKLQDELNTHSAKFIKESHDWRQLCQQVCQNSGACSACFVFFSEQQTPPLVVAGRDWPVLSHWTTADYQAILRDNKFYIPLYGPDADLNSYLAIPLQRGSLSGLLLLNYSVASSSVTGQVHYLTHNQSQLLDILATQGALLWQEKLWQAAPHPEKLAAETSSASLADHNSRYLFKRLKNLFLNVPILVNAFDAQGRCILWNKACEQFMAGAVPK